MSKTPHSVVHQAKGIFPVSVCVSGVKGLTLLLCRTGCNTGLSPVHVMRANS